MDSGGGSQTTIQRSDPPAYAQPYIEYGLGEAQNLYQSGLPQYYPGQTVANQSPETLAGIQALASRGMTGSPLVAGAQAQQAGTIGGDFLDANPANPFFQNAASGGMVNPALGMLQGTAQGDFLNANPYLDAAFDKAASGVRRNVDSLFSAAGRYGSNAHQGTFQEGLNDLATDIYGGNYARERQNMLAAQGQIGALADAGFGRQLSGASGLAGTFDAERARQEAAAGNAPGLAQADYADIQAVLGAGGMRDQYGQQLLNADIARHDFAQNIPAQKLAQYMALVNGGTIGGTVTSQVPTQNNTFGQLGGLGLGLAGLGLQYGLF